jgi:hypothetical protein
VQRELGALKAQYCPLSQVDELAVRQPSEAWVQVASVVELVHEEPASVQFVAAHPQAAFGNVPIHEPVMHVPWFNVTRQLFAL